MIYWKNFAVGYLFSKRRWLYPLISVVVALSLCLGTPLPSRAASWFDVLIRGVEVFQLTNVSERQEIDLGKQINQQITREVRLSRNPELVSYVEQIGRRLVAKSNRPNLPYTFQVVEDDNINAFATAGGFVYVHTGLLKAADNEAQLASVIAHEIGHIGGRHLINQMRQQAIAAGIVTAAGLDRNAAVNIGVDLALKRPRSRKDEYEADKLGLQNLTKSGYAQSEMVAFMQKLLGKGSVPTFLSTHPDTSQRIQQIKKNITIQPSSLKDGIDSSIYKSKIKLLLK
jgi:beta-barrel assembly-enhancing protease